MIIKRLFSLLKNKAPKEQFFLELGSYFIRKGTGYKVGNTFEYKQRKTGKPKTFYISNLFFNFRENKVTYTLSKNPILIPEDEERG